MRRIFREKWTSKWADKNPDESKRKYEELKADYNFVLCRLSPDQIAWGLYQCLEKDEIEFPPEPKGFYKLAKSYEPPIDKPKQLPKPKVDPKKVEHCIGLMRKHQDYTSEEAGETN